MVNIRVGLGFYLKTLTLSSKPVFFNLFATTEPFRKCLLLIEPFAVIQVSVLLQWHWSVVANFVPGNFVLFQQNPW